MSFMESKHVSLKYLLCTIWIILSVFYIAYDQWIDLQQKLQASRQQEFYDLGRVETVKQLLVQASNKECQPFKVFFDKEEISLINVACLGKSAPNNSTPNTPNGATTPALTPTNGN